MKIFEFDSPDDIKDGGAARQVDVSAVTENEEEKNERDIHRYHETSNGSGYARPRGEKSSGCTSVC